MSIINLILPISKKGTVELLGDQFFITCAECGNRHPKERTFVAMGNKLFCKTCMAEELERVKEYGNPNTKEPKP